MICIKLCITLCSLIDYTITVGFVYTEYVSFFVPDRKKTIEISRMYLGY